MAKQPPGSIIVYATSAGATASDGTGRNGTFTAELLNNLRTPGLEVKEMFNRTAVAVQRASGNSQIPAIYLQFFDATYLGGTTPQPTPVPSDWTPASDFELALDGNGVTITKYKGTAATVNIPAVVDGSPVVAIRGAAFEDCSGLMSITIPTSVTAIGVQAFAGCSGLMSISIPTSVTAIGVQAFAGCSGLTSITIPTSVTSIGQGAFGGCSGLTSITIPTSVTSIGQGAFWGCNGLSAASREAIRGRFGDGVF